MKVPEDHEPVLELFGAQHLLFEVLALFVEAEHPSVEVLSFSVAGCSLTWCFQPVCVIIKTCN